MLLSLCMPTNGVVQWVFPVLDSIYSQNIDEDLYEIVITDNGDNQEFKTKIREYLKEHQNIVYLETKALPFINEIEAYKQGNGELLKFVNHRTLLVDGALKRLIDYAYANKEERPITYFSNGVLDFSKSKHEFNTFNSFVKNLSYWSSWSTGMAIWKKDFDNMPDDISEYNELFPHTNVLFNERDRGNYIIDNSIIFEEMSQGKRPKGNYNLYYAFGIEYPQIIEQLLKDNHISIDTYNYILDKNLDFIASLYWNYNFRKKYCSYDLSGLEDMFGRYYKKNELIRKTIKYGYKCIGRKIV